MERKLTSLKEHQDIIYELLYVLDDFCKEHNISYFLAHGTLLGAVRHQGIIPWDDDADVMMERKEYERFKKLVTDNPPTGYKGYSIENTQDYYYPFIKFGKLGTRLVERDWKCVPREGIGVNIDIFPIDGCPNDTAEAEKYVVEKMNEIFEAIHFWCDREWKDFVGIRQKLSYPLYWIKKRRPLLKYRLKSIYNQVQKKKIADSKYFFSFWTFKGSKNLFCTDDIRNLTTLPFGNRKLPVPLNYDAILTKEYGDYMIPPKGKDKESTHVHDIFIEEK